MRIVGRRPVIRAQINDHCIRGKRRELPLLVLAAAATGTESEGIQLGHAPSLVSQRDATPCGVHAISIKPTESGRGAEAAAGGQSDIVVPGSIRAG